MNDKELIKRTEEIVRSRMGEEGTGHDWWHIDRVRTLALRIGEKESVNLLVVELGSLLHDIADHKFHDDDHEIGPKTARDILEELGAPEDVIKGVVDIVANISWSKSKDKNTKEFSKELQVVQDADRLDALGAIGIARAFAYGGHKGRTLYNHEDLDASTIGHFYEKILHLKDRMNTEEGRRVAEGRHAFVEGYLDQLLKEAEGKA